MEGNEAVMGGISQNNDADYQFAKRNHWMDKTYGNDFFETDGGKESDSLGRAKLYYPDIKKEEVVLQETEEFLHKVFDGRMGLMLNTMVEKKVLSKSEIDELYDILKKAEEETKEK